ncbi:MAG: quinone-dependent dihydroorotate dehydrogenase, partial [Micavibrio sp.]
IIGAGGIASAQDAYEKIRSGASLLQLYTALVFQGPALIEEILKGLCALLEKDGLGHISQATGLDA